MQFDTLLIDALTSELRIAKALNGVLHGMEVFRPAHVTGKGRRVGDILLGRIKAVVPGIKGAFVDIGDDRDGFLPFPEKDKKSPYTEGQNVIVQLRYEAMAEKGARLNTKISMSGYYVVYMPGQPGVHISRQVKKSDLAKKLSETVSRIIGPDDGVIIRTAAFETGEDVSSLVEAELTELCDQWMDAKALMTQRTAPAELCPAPDPVLAALRDHHEGGLKRIIIDGAATHARIRSYIQSTMPSLEPLLEKHEGPQPLFNEQGVEDQLEAALSTHVLLPSGGRVAIVKTPACITVDVDSAAASNTGGRAEVIRRTNLEACDALIQQLQLRNLSGHMVIDFISNKDRTAGKELLQHLTNLATTDSVPMEIAGFTRMGLVEALRRKRSMSLIEILCGEGGSQKSSLSVAYDILRAAYAEGRVNPGRKITLECAEPIAGLFANLMKADIKAVQDALGVDIDVRDVAALKPGEFSLHSGG
ncbi:MAG: hypothetical protein HON65_03555 [Rhodospirillales bacterium]|jgi:Rne/Rng family ribonuclease|nr:hypothetical protein [Rhodospirillales bacterium]